MFGEKLSGVGYFMGGYLAGLSYINWLPTVLETKINFWLIGLYCNKKCVNKYVKTHKFKRLKINSMKGISKNVFCILQIS